MNRVITKSQMRDLDNRTIKEHGIPPLILMENAGTACVEEILKSCQQHTGGTAAIACGNGNNGGDGYVIARLLQSHGVKVIIISVGDAEQSPENKANYDRIIQRGLGIIHLKTLRDLDLLNPYTAKISLIIDAIYGIGFHGELDELHSAVIKSLNSINAFRVAIDIPSGLCSDTGNASNAFRANLTLSIEALKYGHLIQRGREFSGECHVVKIGIPPEYFESLKCGRVLFPESHQTPARSPFYHKSDYGRAFIIAGSPGYTGAALLSSKAALRSGAGYVFLMHRPELKGYYDTVIPEILCTQIASAENAKEADTDALLQQLERASSVLIGPGLGTDEYAESVLRACLQKLEIPLILDADAITLISQVPELKVHLAKPNVLITPHVGEFIRIAELDKSAFEADQIGCLQAFVSLYKAKVLLKSFTTIYMDEDQTVFSIAGNDGLATGGSGDVLSGIIVSFTAQKMPLDTAAINASYLMGSTAERIAKIRSTPGIIPSDIIENLFIKENHHA